MPTTVLPLVIASFTDASGAAMSAWAPRSVSVIWKVPPEEIAKLNSSGTPWSGAATVCTSLQGTAVQVDGCWACAVIATMNATNDAHRARLIQDNVRPPRGETMESPGGRFVLWIRF